MIHSRPCCRVFCIQRVQLFRFAKDIQNLFAVILAKELISLKPRKYNRYKKTRVE